IHHRLVDMGLRHHHVAIILYLVTAVAAGLGLFMMVTRDVGTVIVFAAVLLLLLVVFRLVGSVRLREVIARLRQNVALARESARHKRGFEAAMLYLREARDFESWWHALCQAADSMELARLSMTLTNRDGTARTLIWSQAGQDQPSRHEVVSVTVPCQDRRAGPPLTLAVDVPVNGSLESAGHTAAHLGRLMEEHSVAALSAAAQAKDDLDQDSHVGSPHPS
ncbi:hypothetical protein LCGC14_0838700, partial [marine sediment metagenome]